MDVYSYYKSADVDAIVPMSLLVKGQPAVDAGGVLRQVLGEVFVSLSDNEGIKHIFITFFTYLHCSLTRSLMYSRHSCFMAIL